MEHTINIDGIECKLFFSLDSELLSINDLPPACFSEIFIQKIENTILNLTF